MGPYGEGPRRRPRTTQSRGLMLQKSAPRAWEEAAGADKGPVCEASRGGSCSAGMNTLVACAACGRTSGCQLTGGHTGDIQVQHLSGSWGLQKEQKVTWGLMGGAHTGGWRTAAPGLGALGHSCATCKTLRYARVLAITTAQTPLEWCRVIPQGS